MSAQRTWEWNDEPPVRLGQFDHRELQRSNNTIYGRVVRLPAVRLPEGEFVLPDGSVQVMTLAAYYDLLRSLGRW